MTALDYLNSLIIGMEISSLPIQKSELELLKKLIENEKNGIKSFKD